jgi:hypothetical protein
MGESVPTYLPWYWLSRYFLILPAYLPRDRFLPSELAVPLVDTIIARIIVYGSKDWMQI